MLFSSFTFVFQFLPATIVAFAAARLHSARAGIIVLVMASLVFYGAWRPVNLLLLLASVAVNFLLGLAMEEPERRRAVGLCGVALNLSVLGFFKYANFLIDTVHDVSGAQLAHLDVILPLGISFFTFQQIAYLVDVMRGAKVERDIIRFTLFVSFFPHLIAGPLVHHAEMIPQFKSERLGRSAWLLGQGGAIFVAGLFKKVAVADNLAQFAGPPFAHVDVGGSLPTEWAWLAILAYTLQIYFDFSGYSDMAIGLALMFGIRLPVNFRSPYKAFSIIEFWRRWHITLSRFLRDYLYIPLGGNRLGVGRRYLNLMLTMLLGGLWHGAGWTFLIWGGLHGLYLVVNHQWRDHKRRWPDGAVGQAAAWSLTFLAVVIAWVFFRAKTLIGAEQMLTSLAGLKAAGTAYVSDGVVRVMDLPVLVGERWLLLIGWGAVAAALAVALVLPNVPETFRYREYCRAPERRGFLIWRPTLGWALASAAAFAISMFGMWQRVEFLYFQF
jgi:alginate O-acetyltransferase complex protein AlgI